jgi:hypothetical protein
MKLFCVRTLSHTELADAAEHLAECAVCQRELVSTLRRQRGVSDLSFTLAPEFWLRHDHLKYEHLVDFAEDKLDATDRELVDGHLKACGTCQEDVRSFLAFRQQIAPELGVSYGPVKQKPARARPSVLWWWPSLVWKPVYSAAVIVIGITLVIVAAFLLSRRTDDQQAQNVPTPQVSPVLSSPLPSPNDSPGGKPNSTEALVALNDRGGTIMVDKAGNISGLDDVSASMRNEIAQVLVSGRIDRPAILKGLSGEDSALRGSGAGQSFNLIAPSRSVILSNRPTFKWKSVPGATAYTVFVNDSGGQIVAKSDPLAPDPTEWLVTKPLKRGEIYAWTVAAVVDGKEKISPGPSAPEMKFQILSDANLGQLNQLKQVRSHLALGVFYARTGMIAEAEREFQTVVRQNPRSEAATKLLKEIRAWQNR